MSETAIQVKGLGKRYRIGVTASKSASKIKAVGKALLSTFNYLRESVGGLKPEQTLWAIKDVSFEVNRGEVLGIVGRNGSGKSTLLKVLARITDPTRGQARIYGRVGALLEVGTGFHPELTGRENVFLNGAILGMNKQEVRAKFDQIVEFSDMARFVDTRVKYYSSGMRVRLAFSVASFLEPEILLVDEVLAVGDVGFQKKCLGRMGSVADEGRTVLLVSHNMEAVLGLCPRCIWLDQGRLMDDGDAGPVVRQYVDSCVSSAGDGKSLGGDVISGKGLVQFKSFLLQDQKGQPLQQAVCGDPLVLAVDYQCSRPNLSNVTIWIWVRDYLGQRIFLLGSRMTGQDFQRLPERGAFLCNIPKLPLAPGSYLVDLAVRVGMEKTDKVWNAARLDVGPGDFFGSGVVVSQMGNMYCEHSWSVRETDTDRKIAETSPAEIETAAG